MNWRTARSRIGLIALSLVLPLGSAQAQENWPTWRGPTADGVAPTAKPPEKWDEKTNIKWKVKIPGRGSSSPIIWGNKVFIQTAVPSSGSSAPAMTEDHKFLLLCLDRATGKTIWEKTVVEGKPHEGYHNTDGTFASGSAITDGTHIYAYFGSRGLFCYDMDGNLKWTKDLGDMQTFRSFGEGSSPAIQGDKIIITWDHEGDSFITALNKTNGDTIWKTDRPEKTSWATPLIVPHNGGHQIITSATSKIRSYNLEDGKLIWESTGMTRNAIPTPVFANGVVYCTSGYTGNSMMAIKLDGASGDISTSASILWKYAKNTPYVPSPILANGRIYCFSSNNPVLTSFDAQTGKVFIDGVRISGPNNVYASPVAADGKLFIVGRNGTSVVLKQSDTLEILSTNVLSDKIDASPAIVGNEIFLRGLENVYCIAEK